MSMATRLRENIDHAHRVSAQLCAMLQHTYGESSEAFQSMSQRHKDAYLWACSDLAEELARLIETYGEAKR